MPADPRPGPPFAPSHARVTRRRHQVTLFVNHLLNDDDHSLSSEMAAYGDLVRCFVVRAPPEPAAAGGGADAAAAAPPAAAGRSKGYAFVEFALPAAAKAALKALEAEHDGVQARCAARARSGLV